MEKGMVEVVGGRREDGEGKVGVREKKQVRDPLFGRKREEWGEISGTRLEKAAQDLLKKSVEGESQAVLNLPSNSKNATNEETLLECETTRLAASFQQSPSTT
jgi:hypothetical protein